MWGGRSDGIGRFGWFLMSWSGVASGRIQRRMGDGGWVFVAFLGNWDGSFL